MEEASFFLAVVPFEQSPKAQSHLFFLKLNDSAEGEPLPSALKSSELLVGIVGRKGHIAALLKARILTATSIASIPCFARWRVGVNRASSAKLARAIKALGRIRIPRAGRREVGKRGIARHTCE